jgi:hypothetical protein
MSPRTLSVAVKEKNASILIRAQPVVETSQQALEPYHRRGEFGEDPPVVPFFAPRAFPPSPAAQFLNRGSRRSAIGPLANLELGAHPKTARSEGF